MPYLSGGHPDGDLDTYAHGDDLSHPDSDADSDAHADGHPYDGGAGDEPDCQPLVRDAGVRERHALPGHRNGTMDLDWDALARPDQTVVVYMGLKGLGVLCRELVAHGLSPSTPAMT